jgi:hypothetical protein
MENEAADEIAEVARVLTGESVDQIARLITEGASSSRIEAIAGTAAARTALRRLTRLAEPADAAGLALALRAASLAHRHADAEQRVSLVWSGPDAAGAPMRRTEQALCEVIAEARHHLLVTSYTVVAVPAVNRALEGLGINIELGLLIRGGSTPQSVRERFEQLRVSGVLRRVDR